MVTTDIAELPAVWWDLCMLKIIVYLTFALTVSSARAEEKLSLSDGVAAIQFGGMKMVAPKAWGIGLEELAGKYNIVLYPLGLEKGIFGGLSLPSKYPANTMSIVRFEDKRFSSLEEQLSRLQKDNMDKGNDRKTTRLQIEKIGTQQMLVQVADFKNLENLEMETWIGRFNGKSTTYVITMNYEKSRKDQILPAAIITLSKAEFQ